MKRLLIYLFCGYFAGACAKVDDVVTLPDIDPPPDRGIYQLDSLRQPLFCDMIPLRSAQCQTTGTEAFRDCHLDLLFTRYQSGWTGGDGTYSIDLENGTILWMFGDTFLGKVRADRTRPSSPLIRNSVMLQRGDDMKTHYSIKVGQPAAFITPIQEGQWYWPLDATLHHDEIHWMLGRLGSTGGSMWDFAYQGFDLAILDRNSLEIKTIQPVVETGEISFGAAILETADYTYLYGIRTQGLDKHAHVARVSDSDLTGNWEFFDGNDWTSTFSTRPVAMHVSDQFSVIQQDQTYYLITHQTIFGDEVQIMQADRPTGPWTNRRTLFCTPESNEQIFTYNSVVHSQWTTDDTLCVSYNINSFNFSDLFANADLYRPRFVRIANWKNNTL